MCPYLFPSTVFAVAVLLNWTASLCNSTLEQKHIPEAPTYTSYVCLQYHYRPGTFTGWLAQRLDDYSQKRKSEQATDCLAVHVN
jgi:hypothetical protein